jgi:hypothetical protein
MKADALFMVILPSREKGIALFEQRMVGCRKTDAIARWAQRTDIMNSYRVCSGKGTYRDIGVWTP